MNTLLIIFDFLRGKKASIATILGALLVFVLGRGYIAPDTANLIAIILAALGLTVNIGEPIVRKTLK